jgi:dihydrofolate reductase
VGRLLARRLRAARQADERDPQDRVLGLARVRRLGGETTIAAGDLAEAVTRLKRERPDGYLLAHGGARFARSLVETGLIDEYRLVIHPVVLGAGERFFRAPLTIEPVSTTVFSGGAVAHVFAAHP